MMSVSKAMSSYIDLLKDAFFVNQVIVSIGGFAIVFLFYKSFSCVVSIFQSDVVLSKL